MVRSPHRKLPCPAAIANLALVTLLASAALHAASSIAFGQNFSDADNFSLNIFGTAYAEATQYSQTWDAIPAGFSSGRFPEAYGINTTFGNALSTTDVFGSFPKLNNPDLNLGAAGSGLDPRNGAIVLYSSIRFGVLSPNNGRIEVAIGPGAPDGENDVHPRLLATNVWRLFGSSELTNSVLGSSGLLGNPGYNGDAIGAAVTITPAADYNSNANPFFTAGSFDSSKYVHFAAMINLLDATTGAYEILNWYRRDTSSSWTLYQRTSTGFNGSNVATPLSLGAIGADHPFIAGAKQGFVNALGFVGLSGSTPNQVFYGRNSITQLRSNLLKGDFNFDGSVNAADYVIWRKTNVNGQQGYSDWRSNFGATVVPGTGAEFAAALPEPGSCALALVAAMLMAVCRKNKAQI